VVVHAANEWEDSTLLKACPVDVVCIDSKLMAESGGAEITADVKDTSPHVPVMLVQTGNSLPKHY
jgi:DNA-binding NarL/FixJ family response regulator